MRLLLLIAFVGFCKLSIAQDSTLVDKDFHFKEGIYLTAEDLKQNNPISPDEIAYIISDVSDDEEFIKQVKGKRIELKEFKGSDGENTKYYFNNSWKELIESEPNYSIWIDGFALNQNDTVIEYSSNEILAFSFNDRLFMQIGKKSTDKVDGEKMFKPYFNKKKYFETRFFKATFIGNIMLVTNDGSIRTRMSLKSPNKNGANPHYNRMYNNPLQTKKHVPSTLIARRSAMKQYMIDLSNGGTKLLDTKNLENLIELDKSIFTMYKQTKNRKDILPYFVKKYNEKYPLYVPN